MLCCVQSFQALIAMSIKIYSIHRRSMLIHGSAWPSLSFTFLIHGSVQFPYLKTTTKK